MVVDSFNLSLEAPTTTLPGYVEFPISTATFGFHSTDSDLSAPVPIYAQTPLFDSNGDGVVDTEPLNPGETMGIALRAIVPYSAIAGDQFSKDVRATSVSDNAVSDITRIFIENINAPVVDGAWDNFAGHVDGTPANPALNGQGTGDDWVVAPGNNVHFLIGKPGQGRP